MASDTSITETIEN